MSATTYSLEEAAEILCGKAEAAELEWLSLRLRHKSAPFLNGFKQARRWRMTQADIDEAIAAMRPQRVDVPTVPQVSGMTRTSRRRLAS